MFTPIIIPSANRQEPSFESRLNDAALLYSSDQVKQISFKSGARWANKSEDVSFIWIIFLILVTINFFAGVIGLITPFTSSVNESNRIGGKWDYILPAYTVGHRISEWMGK